MSDLQHRQLIADIGAVTGVIGTLTGLYSLKKTSDIKSIDLRLELGKGITSLHSEAKDLLPLIEEARTSRERMSAARGTLISGETEQWNEKVTLDEAQVKSIVTALPSEDEDYKGTCNNILIKKIVKVDKERKRVEKIKKFYIEAMDTDKQNGQDLKKDMRATRKPK